MSLPLDNACCPGSFDTVPLYYVGLVIYRLRAEMEPGDDFWPMTRRHPIAFDLATQPNPVIGCFETISGQPVVFWQKGSPLNFNFAADSIFDFWRFINSLNSFACQKVLFLSENLENFLRKRKGIFCLKLKKTWLDWALSREKLYLSAHWSIIFSCRQMNRMSKFQVIFLHIMKYHMGI